MKATERTLRQITSVAAKRGPEFATNSRVYPW